MSEPEHAAPENEPDRDADPDERADELEHDAREMQQRSDELEHEIGQTRQDWDAKRRDPDEPGAPPPEKDADAGPAPDAT